MSFLCSSIALSEESVTDTSGGREFLIGGFSDFDIDDGDMSDAAKKRMGLPRFPAKSISIEVRIVGLKNPSRQLKSTGILYSRPAVSIRQKAYANRPISDSASASFLGKLWKAKLGAVLSSMRSTYPQCCARTMGIDISQLRLSTVPLSDPWTKFDSASHEAKEEGMHSVLEIRPKRCNQAMAPNGQSWTAGTRGRKP